MSDARIRELERRWKQSGRDDDCAAWLGLRHQFGEVTRKFLVALAALGHAPASMVLEEEPPWLDDRNAVFVAAAQLPQKDWAWVLLAVASHYPAESMIPRAGAAPAGGLGILWSHGADHETARLLARAIGACGSEASEDSAWDQFQHVLARLVRGPSPHALPGWPGARRLVLAAALVALGGPCGTARPAQGA